MLAYRIADRRHPIFDSTGAYLKSARWNSVGKRVIYAAQSYAGALLEILVHLNLGVVPKTYVVVEITIPDTLAFVHLHPEQLPDWAANDLVASRQYGDLWLEEKRTAVLLVPSVVLQGREHNVMINPGHADFTRIQAGSPEPVMWDPRLFIR